MAKKTSNKIVVPAVRIAPGVVTKVTFKEVRDGVVRAKPKGFPSVVVRYTERGAVATTYGCQPVAANRPEKAFAKCVKQNSLRAQKLMAKAKKARANA